MSVPKRKRGFLGGVYKVLRALLLSAVIAVVAIPVTVYVALSTPWAQDKIRDVAQTELSSLLGTKVTIEKVAVVPFNRIAIHKASVDDDFGKTALTLNSVEARFEMLHFLRTGKIVIDYADIDGLHATIYKADRKAPLNIAGIIEKLKGKDEKKKETPFDLAISTVIIRNASATYDVKDAPRRNNRFDANHISVTGLELNASLPKLSNEKIIVDLEHLAVKEASGLQIAELTTRVCYSKHNLEVTGLDLEMPHSHLRIADMNFEYADPKEISKLWRETPVSASIADGSMLTPSDLQYFLPALAKFTEPVAIHADIVGNAQRVDIERVALSSVGAGQNFSISVAGTVHKPTNVKELSVEGLTVKASTDAATIQRVLALAPAKTANALSRPVSVARTIDITAEANGTLNDVAGKLTVLTGAGKLIAEGSATKLSTGSYSIDATAATDNLQVGSFIGNDKLGAVTANVQAVATLGKIPEGEFVADISSLQFKGKDLGGINIQGQAGADRSFGVDIDLDNPYGRVALTASGNYAKEAPRLQLKGVVAQLDLPRILDNAKYLGYKLNTVIDAELAVEQREKIDGRVLISDLQFHDTEGEGKPLDIRKFSVAANTFERPNSIVLESDFLNGHFDGRINPFTVGRQVLSIISPVMPALIKEPGPGRDGETANDFTFELSLANAENVSNFLSLPVQIVYPVTIDGGVNYQTGRMDLTVDAPYLQQKGKIIDNTVIGLNVDRNNGLANIYATTNMPTQKGPMALVAALTAANNRVDTKVNWEIDRQKAIGGDLSVSTLLGRDPDGKLTADVNLNPGTVNFGDAIWTIAPSRITWADKNLVVDNFHIYSGLQDIHLNGVANQSPMSLLQLKLRDIRLVKIFETLDINNALIGGRATGNFDVHQLFGGEPMIVCNDLHVDSISYNYCVLGNAEVKAHWDNEKKGVHLDGDVTQFDGRHARIYGDIIPAGERLDLNIEANHTPIGFMKPFMAAFTSDVNGFASGRAHLFGTFKNIDLVGDLYADELGLKIAFTNTWYYARRDSVHMRPGLIELQDITVSDQYGNTAKLNGWLRHKYFHEPSFDFRVTDANNLLCYNVTPKLSPDWYGRIFGDGSATVSGRPGVVNISANMRTTAGSNFTFVLSDMQEADDYTFITFRDPTKGVITDTIIEVDALPRAVREYRDRQLAKAAAASVPSAYNMDIQVDITPEAAMTIVMDPVGGDEIKAVGSGNLRMTYASQGNDLRMYGTYTIDQGKYNFTLQDIIVKDFTIKEGSSIAFTGDPYAARLDIKAIYNVNANLSDLDESFLTDRDLNRTNVPVHAVLMAQGDMRQPDVSFDLEFPTLTSDVDRKVKSIISTEEMMNRQIIYLLALNRFYTPDYMSTTKGNELFSVASSTLSSQLSNMLGKISDKWSIAPNVRSDRGDFSDVEVDVALSSSLFNDRLRLNGNFGYRDNTMNTNQFIGDVDVEYLLNRKGTWRLKAYNRFNDQNYYLRTAQTTQGIGIMFKRDFDVLFNFLRRGKKTEAKVAPADTTDVQKAASPADTHQDDGEQGWLIIKKS